MLDMLRRQARVIGGTILTPVLLAVLVTSQLTPLYTGRALLLVDPREARVVNIDGVVSRLPANSATIESEVEVIKSDRVAIDVIQSLQLLATQDFAVTKSLVDWLRATTGFAGTKTDRKPHPSAALVKALELFGKRLFVRRRGLTYVIEIAFTAQEPDLAANVVNALTRSYLRQQTEGKLEINQRAADLLRERLTALSRQLATSESAIDEFMQAQVDVALLGKSSQNFEQAMLAWRGARQESEKASARFKNVQKRVASGDYVSAAAMLNSSAINDLVSLRRNLAQKEGTLRSQSGGQGRDLFDLQNELRTLTSRIREDVATQNAKLRVRVAQVDERRKLARENVRALAAKNRQSSGVALELWKLQQNTEATRGLYETFLSRLRQTEQLQSVQLADSRVISAALPPIEPSYPPSGLIYILTFLFSAGLGVGLGYARDTFAQDVHGQTQLEQALDIPVVASIPHVTPSGQALANGQTPANGQGQHVIDMVADHPMSIFAEAVRRARIGLELAVQNGHLTGRKKSLCVMVTAAVSGEGKSTLAVLLARSWTQAGKKVVLVDFDFRRPSIQRLFGGLPETQAKPGTTTNRDETAKIPREFQTDPKSTVKYVHAKNYVVASETETGITEETIRRIIQNLTRRFDIIVIDAPPILPVIDARLVLPSVDITLFVVRAHSTPHSKIHRALRDVRQADKPVVAALNGVKFSSTADMGYDPYARAYE